MAAQPQLLLPQEHHQPHRQPALQPPTDAFAAAPADAAPALAAAAGGGLTAEQLQQFDEDGFLVIENFFPLDDARRMLARSRELLEEFALVSHPKTKFTTSMDNLIGGDYFMQSGDKVRFFFEIDALDGDGNLLVPKLLSVNKIGHALHVREPIFHEFSTRDRIKAISKSLGYKDARIMQSMIVLKNPRIGGEVPTHQDSTFQYTDPPSTTAFWFALEDCTPENACLWFAKGSHKRYNVLSRVTRKEEGGLQFIRLEPEPEGKSEEIFTCVPVKAGSLVLIHGQVLHRSPLNKSAKSRNVYTFQVIEGEFPYPADNWLQPTPETPFLALFDGK